jgi:hypothetical protein
LKDVRDSKDFKDIRRSSLVLEIPDVLGVL